jgi:hypothetical protein
MAGPELTCRRSAHLLRGAPGERRMRVEMVCHAFQHEPRMLTTVTARRKTFTDHRRHIMGLDMRSIMHNAIDPGLWHQLSWPVLNHGDLYGLLGGRLGP